ncbi:ABC transporter permease [Arthrobacter nitrophenolicus]|nr:iron ABC transporter permease [Arthrobacter nitrophenolicus]
MAVVDLSRPRPDATGPASRQKMPKPFALVIGAVAVVILFLTAFPLLKILGFSMTLITDGSLQEITSTPWFWPMIRDTTIVVGAHAVITVAIAAGLAWINERTNARMGVLSDVLPLIPLFLPAVAMAIGWSVLAAPDVGFFNGALNGLLGPLGIDWQLNIYSYVGVIFVYVLHSVPYAYLPIAAAFRNSDSSLEEAARVSGASNWTVLRTISIPAIIPAVVSAFVLVTIVGFSLYSVPVVLGNKAGLQILQVQIVNSIQGSYPARYDHAIAISTLLLVTLAVFWYVQNRITRKGHFAKISGKSGRASRVELGRSRWIFRTLLGLYLLLSAVLPVAALVIVSLQAFWQPNLATSIWTLDHFNSVLFENPIAGAAIRNSLVLGLIVGAITVVLAALVVVYAQISKGRLGKYANWTGKVVPAAIPNSVLAVGFILALSGPPFSLGGTLLIVALAYFIAFLPYASIAIESSAAQIGGELREASALSGAGPGRTFRSVILPLLRPGLFAAWALVFVRGAGELEMAVLLGSGNSPLMGFLLLDVFQQGSYNQMAALALTMTCLTMPVVFVMMLLGKPRWKRSFSASRKETAS